MSRWYKSIKVVIDYTELNTFYNTNFLTTNLSAINFFILVQKIGLGWRMMHFGLFLKYTCPNKTQVWRSMPILTLCLIIPSLINFLIYIYELQSHRLGKKKNYKFVETPTFTHMVVFEPLKVPIYMDIGL